MNLSRQYKFVQVQILRHCNEYSIRNKETPFPNNQNVIIHNGNTKTWKLFQILLKIQRGLMRFKVNVSNVHCKPFYFKTFQCVFELIFKYIRLQIHSHYTHFFIYRKILILRENYYFYSDINSGTIILITVRHNNNYIIL